MRTRAEARVPQASEDRIADPREHDPLYCELVELEERYVEGSAWRQRKFDLWLAHDYWRRKPARIAAREGMSVTAVRRHVRSVRIALRQLHGEPFGHPVEKVLGYG